MQDMLDGRGYTKFRGGDEWEMDAQGVRQVAGAGRVSVINIGDPYSHLRVGSAACPAKSKADTADYQLALRRAFLRFGRPARLSLDIDARSGARKATSAC